MDIKYLYKTTISIIEVENNLLVIINGVGHSTIQFKGGDYGDGEIIELHYTGSPKIVLRELQILFQKAKEKERQNNVPWLTAEYITLFRKENDPISISNDEGLWVDFSYKVECDYDEWRIDYIHYDARKSRMGEVIVDFIDGTIFEDNDSFWKDCEKNITVNINNNTITKVELLEKELLMIKSHVFVFRTIAVTFSHPKFFETYDKIKQTLKFSPYIENILDQFLKNIILKIKKNQSL